MFLYLDDFCPDTEADVYQNVILRFLKGFNLLSTTNIAAILIVSENISQNLLEKFAVVPLPHNGNAEIIGFKIRLR